MDDTSHVRVLVVDDSEGWRTFITTFLQNEGVQVIETAVNGVEAVRKARALQPPVILMDVDLPDMNGIEAARQIRAFTSTSRILFVSSHADPVIVDAALQTGASGYILKSRVSEL